MTQPTNDPSVIAGRYEVVSRLGAGAFGTVYKAKDTMLGRLVAIKTIRLEGLAAQGASVEELVRRFKGEARVSAQLKHPNIVTIYDIGESAGLSYLAMEFIDGPGLDRVIAGAGRMPVERAATLAAQVADALDFAHRHSVVHRDIKPANIMVEAGDRVKVTDFGIAKVLDSAEQLTATGSLLGTPSYMSPEQARGAAVDGRSDLFAVGCILYEMLSGSRAFRADSITGLIFKIITEEPKPLRELEPNLPEPVLALVDKALAKAPEGRFQTGRELADALLALTHAGAVPTLRTEDMGTTAGGLKREDLPTMPGAREKTTAGPPPPPPPPAAAAPRSPAPPPRAVPRPVPAPATRSRGPLLAVAAIGLGVVVLAAAGAIVFLRGRGEPTPPPTTIAALPTPEPEAAAAGATGRVGEDADPGPEAGGDPEAPGTTAPPAEDRATTSTPAPTAPPPTAPPVRIAQATPPPPAATSFLDESLPDDDDGRRAGERLAESYRGGRSNGGGGYAARGAPRQRYPRDLQGLERAAVLALRHLVALEHAYFRANGSYGNLQQITRGGAGLGVPATANTFERRGYRFQLTLQEDGYTLLATPVAGGGRPFVADDTGFIRPGLE